MVPNYIQTQQDSTRPAISQLEAGSIETFHLTQKEKIKKLMVSKASFGVVCSHPSRVQLMLRGANTKNVR